MSEAPALNSDMKAFLAGDCSDPAALFGWFPDPPDPGAAQGARVRAFLPRAARVELVASATGEVLGPMRMVHPEGIFECHVDRAFFPYQFRVHGWGDTPRDMEDPYRFGSALGELDIYLMAEGTHLRLYEKLGAHPVVRDGVAGVEFAVWAPNARRVSVVGQFNNWDGRRHIMRRFSSTGVWELFVPGMAPGDLYKFELKSQDGRMLPLKADPFAFRCEHAPGTASVSPRSRPTPGAMARGWPGAGSTTATTPPSASTKCTWAPGAGARTAAS